MVGKYSRRRILLVGIVLAVFLLTLVSGALAQGLQEEQSFTLEEETLIEINDVGDAHITDPIAYDSPWFDEYGYVFEDNPSLLSRRYRSDSNVGEVENFDADIDYRKSTSTVSFDTPALVYNKGGNWDIYGYSNYELNSKNQNEVVLDASWVLTNEFTLFESMPLEETVIFDLPDNASNADFNQGTGTIQYQLPYVEKQKGGILAGNKTLFTIIFALVMALSFFLFLFAITRKVTVPAAAMVAAPPFPGPTVGAPPPAPDISAAQPSGVPPLPPGVSA